MATTDISVDCQTVPFVSDLQQVTCFASEQMLETS
jgi:hypothetical protein